MINKDIFKGKFSLLDVSLFILIVGTIGMFLQVYGLNWDLTMHLHRNPGGERLLVDAETFLSNTHSVLYSGVGFLAVASAIAGIVLVLLKKKKDKSESIDTITVDKNIITAFKLMIIGVTIQLIAGPSDQWWHKTFGLDGLLSPPHIGLLSGMLINAIAVTFGLMSISKVFKKYSLFSNRKKTVLIKSAMMVAFTALWFSSIWFTYALVLPVSKGERTNNNLNPLLATTIAVLAIPLISTVICLGASNVIGNGKFGYMSVVGLLFIEVNVFANIIPSNHMASFLPYYLIVAGASIIIADFVLNGKFRSTNKNKDYSNNTTSLKRYMITGLIIGSTFYICNFPMLGLTFANFYGFPLKMVILNEFSNFVITLPATIMITIMVGSIMGLLGSIIFKNKIEKRLMKYTIEKNEQEEEKEEEKEEENLTARNFDIGMQNSKQIIKETITTQESNFKFKRYV